VTSERWEQVKSLFESALAVESSQRVSFVSGRCGSDEELQREVMSLLASYDETGEFLENPVFSAPGFAEAALEPNLIGQRVGPWQIVEEIGRGGMGTVYLAVRADNEFRKRVAVKLIRGGMETDFAIRRFRNERQILARLEHPNIARLIDGGKTENGMPYYVMEYVEGEPLNRYCESRALPVRERVRIFLDACAAVHYAHRRMIIHRDLKPGNILVKQDGTPKLLDFGIAKLLDPERSDIMGETTMGGFRIVTPAYASPEQMRGETATARSDIYSLGIVLFELVTGRRPSTSPGGDPFALPEPAVDDSTELLLRELRKVVIKATRSEPEERYESVEAFIADIQRALKGIPIPGYVSAGDASTSEAPSPGSVAVLPFRLLATDSTSDGYLGLGITDAVITKLSNIGRISVRPTSAVMNYGPAADAVAVGRELSVEFVLEGRVQKVGEHVRTTVQLVRVETRKPVWAASFEERVQELLKVEDSIAEQVAHALVPQLTGEEREQLARPGTRSAKAHQAYLRGRYYWTKHTDEALAKALVCFMEAIAEDPQYARAHAGVADYYVQLGIRGGFPPAESFAAAKEAAQRAIDIDPMLAEAHASLGVALWAYDHDFGAAAHHLQLAIALNPDYAPAHDWLGILNSAQGRAEMAIVSLERARKLDPHSAMYATDLAHCYYNARQYDRALEFCSQAVHITGEFPGLCLVSALSALALGRVADALRAARRAVELDGGTPISLAILARVYAEAGNAGEAADLRLRLNELTRTGYVSDAALAMADLACGDADHAFTRLEQGFKSRDWWTVWLCVSPIWDPLRGDPRFPRLLRPSKWPRGEGEVASPASPKPPARLLGRPAVRAVAAGLALAVVALAFAYWTVRPRPAPFQSPNISRVTIDGTAESASISPDGRYVAYTARSDGGLSVWLRDLNDAAPPVRIAGPFDAEIPMIDFARAGADLVFTTLKANEPSGGEMHAYAIGDGRLRTLVSKAAAPMTISADESRVVFLRANPQSAVDELIVRNVDGSGERVIAVRRYPDRFTWSARPVWSPDGRRIACSVAGADQIGFRFALAVVDAGDGAMKVLETPRWQTINRIIWMRDSKRVLVAGQVVDQSFRQIWHVPVDRGGASRITNDLNDYSGLGISQDGSELVSVQTQSIVNIYAFKRDDPDNAVQLTRGGGRYFDVAAAPNGDVFYASDSTGVANIWMIPRDGGGQRQLTFGLGRSYSPALSPDGKTVAFHSNRGGSWNIWKMNRDGSSPVQLTKDARDSNWPQFTPDGRYILYHHSGEKVLSTVWKAPVDGGAPIPVIARESMYPTMARDGKLACWINEQPANPVWKIVVFRPDGGFLRSFAFEGNEMPSPRLRWTPRSDAIAYVVQRNGVGNIWLQPIDGGPARRLTSFTWGRIYSFDWMPDGRIVCSRGMTTSDVVLIREST
jgi:serine/threonine protein kinase/Tol biopolymer transport system component/tetratricopeptide (TPR) repeat protein